MSSTSSTEPAPYLYAVTYGRLGLPTTKIIDLQRDVYVGTRIFVDGQWWRVSEVLPSGLGASHLGHVMALPE